MTPRKILHCLALGTALAAVVTTAIVSVPARAQFGFGGIVYDPSNYAQNVLTAARTLEQVNNQIRMLQNQAASLVNEARNLESLPLSILQPLEEQIRQTQQLLREAQRIAYDVREIEAAFDRHYRAIPLDASQQALVDGAEARWANSVSAFEVSLKVQA
uniref:P-type conjugative transfer protein TrbJ n=1 Tax=Erythrobacter sp. TaxID=1042 RepID=UPI00311F28F3